MNGPDPSIHTQAKYISRNPISRYLIRHFCQTAANVLRGVSFGNMLDAGCGEGVLLASLRDVLGAVSVAAFDIDVAGVAAAKSNAPFARYSAASLYDIPFADNAFDLALCCEVLEHLDRPGRALKELRRVVRGHCLFTVPREPLWRILNMARGSYWRQLGNTPGHVNHWGKSSFLRLIQEEFDVIKPVSALPWTGALCRPK